MAVSNKINRGPRVVVIGGGTGSFTLLSGFKKYTSRLTALVNMSDDGSSTGVLRDELGVLPPGDVRRCLVALSESPKIRDLFEYRFDEGNLKGHAFGNLFLAALEKMTGSFAEAIETASSVLNVRGDVVPATLNNVRLKLTWSEMKLELLSERVIDAENFKYDPRQATLSLVPPATANPKAVQSIAEADIVVIAPGDLYTSLGPILVINGLRGALISTPAKVIYVCNLVTKKGQTDGFDVSAHVAEIERFVGTSFLDKILYNAGRPSADLLRRYAKEGEYWVNFNARILADAHYEAVGADFVARKVDKSKNNSDPLVSHRTYIRHNADRVAKLLFV